MDFLKGIVEIYPALNPLGVDSISRGIPMFDLDMNRIFPGDENGAVAEHVASRIMGGYRRRGSVYLISMPAIFFLREIPQARINVNTARELVPYARRLNLDFVWIHGAATVLESTLAHSLNSIGVPTIVVEMGVGMRVTEEFCHQLTDGIFCVMKDMGVWDGEVITPKEPIISQDGEVGFVNAAARGFCSLCRALEKRAEGGR